MPAESSERELGGRGSGKRFELGANAVAGAIAGTLVSIVLHPVDTIKVTIQADRKVREPIAMVVSRIIRQRGVFGLYSDLPTFSLRALAFLTRIRRSIGSISMPHATHSDLLFFLWSL